MENNENIEVFESVVVKKDDVSISITGSPDGILAGRTGEQVLMYCSDVLQKATGEGSFEEHLEALTGVEQTLKVNYNWSDIEFNEFVKVWRRNLYMLKIGEDNHVGVDLKEYQNFITYIEHKKKVEAGEMSDIGAQSADELQRFAEQAIADSEGHVDGAEAKIMIDGKLVPLEEVTRKKKK